MEIEISPGFFIPLEVYIQWKAQGFDGLRTLLVTLDVSLENRD